MDRICQNCRFWDAGAVITEPTEVGGVDFFSTERGQCKLNPPELRRKIFSLVSVYPETSTEDFCGQWQEADPEILARNHRREKRCLEGC